ncbi:MAG TPA: hypothetical protein PLY76_13995, partial [Flavobacteriales bacterium]|nr:hypothetical protein [Flavobacteriales bacterium]
MKKHSSLGAFTASAALVLACAANAGAQVATTYAFSSSTGTQTLITGGTKLNSGNAFDDEVYMVNFSPAFTFDGTAYTTMYVSTNGFITFGSGATASNYTPLSSNAGYSGAIAPFGADLDAANSGTREVRWQVVGAEVVVQWRGAQRYAFNGNEAFTLQVRLNTTTGEIKFIYSNVSNLKNSTLRQPEVGLRGPNNTFSTNVNNRLVGTGSEDWDTSLPGTANDDKCRFTNQSPSKSFSAGLTYTWTPCTPPTINSVTSNSPICSADALQLHVDASGTGLTYLWTGTGTFSPDAASADVTVTNAATGSYSVAVSNSCTTVNGSVSVTVNQSPTGVSATSSTNSVCASSNLVDLTATGSIPGATILSQDFNSGIAPWTTTNTSTGGTPANAAWTARADGYTVSSQTFHSNDASQFVMSNSDAQGNGGTTATTIQSPSFSTVGYTDATLTFYHHFRAYSGDDNGNVEVSTNGSSWTSLQTISSTQGSSAGFVQSSVSLSAYLNQPTVYVRFRYAATWDWYWAIDNVTVTGTGTPSFAWTSTPAGFTSNVQNPTGVAVTQNTVFTVTAASTNGCTVQANTGTITYLNPSATISYPAGPHAIGSGTLSVTQTGTPGGSYSATPAGLALNATTGEIDLATSSAGTYTVTYGANTPCPYSTTTQVVLAVAGCMDPLADNYNSAATSDDGSCTYCAPTITYNAPTPTPITIGSGIPDQNMAVSQDCRGIDVALSAFERYVGAIIPAGNVYTTTTGNSPTSGSDPTPDPVMARWNLLGSIDLGTYDFTQVNVFLDLDFDPAAAPVWNTMNLSQGMINNGMGALHVYQASENLAAGYWGIAFPGVTFDPHVPGVYDIRVRLESASSNEELVNLAIQVVVQAPEITYYSQGSGNFNNPIWDVVPVGTASTASYGPTANFIVQNGHTVANTADVDVKNLTVNAGGTLALGSATTLTVHGDEAIFDGALTAANTSTLALAGADATILESTGGTLSLWNLTVSTPQGTLTDATLNIRGTLQLDAGDFDASLGNVTLTSTASGTGRLGPVGANADYIGNLTVQRFIP